MTPKPQPDRTLPRVRLEIAPDLEIEAALAKIRSSPGPHTLVIGSWGSALARPVELKRLAVLAVRLQLDIEIESPDRQVIELAGREGFAARLNTPPGFAALGPLWRTYALLTNQAGRWGQSRLTLWIGGPIALLAVISAGVAMFWLALYPSARVELELEQFTPELELVAYANPSFSAINPRQNLLPGRIISSAVSGSIPVVGRGAREVASSRAAGAVLVVNLTEQVLEIPRGTVVTGPADQRFVFDTSLALPSQADLGALLDPADPPEQPVEDATPTPVPELTPVPSSLELALSGVEILPEYPFGRAVSETPQVVVDQAGMRVGIRAETGGPEGNLPAGSELRAIGPFGGLVRIAQLEDFAGGSREDERFVTDADRQAALGELVARLREMAQGNLLEQIRPGQYGQVLPDSQLRPEFNSTYLATVGANGETESSYQVDLTLQATVFERADLEQLAFLLLTGAETGRPVYRLLPGSLRVGEPILSATLGNTVTMHFSAGAGLERQVDPDEVRDNIAGKDYGAAKSYLDRIEGVSASDLHIFSPLGSGVTFLTPRISVEIRRGQ